MNIIKAMTDPSLFGRRESRQRSPIVRRLTASVLIDERRLDGCEDRFARQEEIREILDVIKNAVGYDPDRDITVVVLANLDVRPVTRERTANRISSSFCALLDSKKERSG